MLAQALESAMALDDTRYKLEVIVVDDSSTDSTSDVVAGFPVRYLYSRGLSVQSARDAGLKAATGSFVMFLDDDDVLLPEAIGAQLDVFRIHPEYGAVHARSELVDESLASLDIILPDVPVSSGWILTDLLAYTPQIATVLTRAEVARAAGPFDPLLPGGEDWDWILRIAGRFPIGRIETPVMRFRMRSDPEEALDWKRFPALKTIFRRHTRHMAVSERIRVRPILWRHRGRAASRFVLYAQENWELGHRRRALASLNYAFRCSPAHTAVMLGRVTLVASRSRLRR